MYQDEERIEAIFQVFCEQLESFRDGPLQTNEFRILERRSEYHESEECRAKEQLPILLNELKQREIYKQINLNKNIAKNKAEAYRKAKLGL